jgi:hypothetical protein
VGRGHPSIVLPAVFAPVVAGLVARLGTWLVFKIVTGVPERGETRDSVGGRSDPPPWCAGSRHQRCSENHGRD